MSSTTMRGEIWRERLADWWADAWRWVLAAFGAAPSTYCLLDRASSNGAMLAAVIGALVVAAALTGFAPLAIALFAMPGLLSPSGSDSAGATCRFPMWLSRRRSAPHCSWASARTAAAAQAAPAEPRLPVHHAVHGHRQPVHANTVEWFHAWLLISGALIVGWALGAAGYARLALTLIVFTACVIAVLTLFDGRHPIRGRQLRSRDSGRGRCRCTRTSPAPCWPSRRSSPT